MSEVVIKAMIKASMMKEALASCQMEGIGLDLTLEDLYLAELGIKKKINHSPHSEILREGIPKRRLRAEGSSPSGDIKNGKK